MRYMKLSCELIKDLLPLYCDGICSGETKAAVEEHLTECGSCSEELKKMKNNFPVTVLQKEEGGFIIGGYKMILIRKFIILLLCVFALPLMNACFSLLFGTGTFFYSFFITALVLAQNIFIQKIKTKNRSKWLLASTALFPVLMIAVTLKFTGSGVFSSNWAHLLYLIPIGYFIFSVVRFRVRCTEEPLTWKQYKKTLLPFLIYESAVLTYLGYVSGFTHTSESHPTFGELTLTAFALAFVWLGYIFFKRYKRNPIFNTGVCAAAVGIFLPTFAAVYGLFFDYSLYTKIAFWHANLLDSGNPANYFLQILIILCAIGAALIAVGYFIENKTARSVSSEESEQAAEESKQTEQAELTEKPEQSRQPEESEKSAELEKSDKLTEAEKSENKE